MKLGTHNGTFHADDVLAYVILSELFKDAELTRSRDKDTLLKLDIVFDVGGGQFDHHTKDKEFRTSGIPFAAAGLIWRQFGKDLIAQTAPDLSALEVEKIHLNVDESFIAGLDAVDNGITLETSFPIPNLADVVHWFNPGWDASDDEDHAFLQASSFARTVFLKSLQRQFDRVRARQYVISAFDSRQNSKLLILERGGHWLDTLLEIDKKNEVLFVVYPDTHRGYRLQTVRRNKGTFASRKDLPEAWAGLPEDELNQVIGVSDAIFCHPARFIAGAESFESVLKMAHMAIES
ncbi:MYG1 family protein [Alicyclobacillus sp. SO9]|uniref:MYG1 family protein n=1 Tax=Alicyclobacillus sp. SO9 TaxID=2665646 RepID=UPI0018E768C5|nr:MYG1 family protein [Alicyclobacillus sp. SO9]QQE79819.1 MYG1 family protein [Alicyclobacillus sp. SO9]